MTSDINELRERYSALSNDEFQNLALSGGLTEQTRELLDQELGRRGIQEVNEYQQNLENYDRKLLDEKQQILERRVKRIRLEKRIGYGLACLGVLKGLCIRLVQQYERNGAGIIITSVILFPLLWILVAIRRPVWRFLLRPWH